jgi:hypothetical protein
MLLPALETDTLLSVAHLSASATDEARVVAAVLGVLLLLWGPRSKRLVSAAPGILLGALLAASFLADQNPSTQAMGAGAAGLVGGFLALMLQATALRLAGALVGAVAAASAYPLIDTAPLPWWVPISGAVVGLLVVPRMFRSTLKLLSPVFGAICLCFAANLEADQQLYALIGFSLLGYAVQAGLARRGTRVDSET